MVGWLIYAFVSLLGRTQRLKVDDVNGICSNPPARPLIFAHWHNRLALMPYYYKRMMRGRRSAVMISASRDGTLLSSVVVHFGLVPIRGSTSRFGSRALRQLADKIAEGCDAGITPDGPRGPKYFAQHGVVSLAQLTGAPIVPLSYRLSWKFELDSWDRFQVPLPFGQCNLKIGAPIVVPTDADDATRRDKLRELETALLELGGDKRDENAVRPQEISVEDSAEPQTDACA